LAQPFMLVMVWRQGANAPSSYGVLFSGDITFPANSTAYIFNKGVSNNYSFFTTSEITQSVAVATNTTYHSRAVFNGASSSSVLNGSSVTGNPGSHGVTNGITFSSTVAAAQYSNAWYGEVFIIPNPTAADATNAAAYTLAKWGI